MILFLSSEPSVRRKASLPSVPSTLRKQLVVCPIPDGRTLSHSIALITELFPLLVLQNKVRRFNCWYIILDSWSMEKLKMNTPSKENHLHVPPGEHFSNPSHLSEVAKDLLDLLLSGDRVHILIFVSTCHNVAIKLRSMIIGGH